MNRMLGLAVLLVTLSGASSAAEICKFDTHFGIPVRVCAPAGGSGLQPAAAPEIDPASAMTGLALTVGGLVVLRSRRIKTSKI